ncbi:HAMP domain-containing histidine kinase [Actinomadura rudentiformis]|uniref:Signal transduction histidine-protein kinase/phosphatase MprB n=1 Tax=Actinomadura rudentiformis TaxID=359158 RepID=A0A6H9YA40_9ACTN|nr:HAMP domain-containing histidine kinase [Actinomadura rudentiformis]
MRRQLTFLVVAIILLILIAFFLPLVATVRSISADDRITQAAVEAESIVPLLMREDPETVALSLQSLAAGDSDTFSVFLPSGRVLGDPAARTDAVRLAERGHSLVAEVPGGREVLLSVVGRQDGPIVVRAFVSDAVMYEGVTEALATLALLGLLLLLIGVLVTFLLATRLTRPLRELADVSRRLGRGDLAARARGGGAAELVEVAAALNYLARRISELVKGERERIADLSHRLRTPLTALRLEADMLGDPAERAKVNRTIDQVESTVTDAIKTVRGGDSGPGACDAATVIAERMEFWTVLATEQGRSIGGDISNGPLLVAASSAELSDAFDVLISNIFSHTPDGTDFSVTLTPRPNGGAVLEVADDGPGFADTRVRRGRSGGGSSGLGLDIVRRVTEVSGGRLILDAAPSGGALVRAELGPP